MPTPVNQGCLRRDSMCFGPHAGHLQRAVSENHTLQAHAFPSFSHPHPIPIHSSRAWMGVGPDQDRSLIRNRTACASGRGAVGAPACDAGEWRPWASAFSWERRAPARHTADNVHADAGLWLLLAHDTASPFSLPPATLERGGPRNPAAAVYHRWPGAVGDASV
jgi:hypothetical protein